MSRPPRWVEDEMIQVLVAIMGRDEQRAKEGYKRLSERPEVLLPVICGWARGCGAGTPGEGVITFEIDMLDGSAPGPRQLAVGRVISCMSNGDIGTALDVLHALEPLDCMLVGWDIARMAAATCASQGEHP